MAETSNAMLTPNASRNDAIPDTLALGVEASYELAERFFREAKYGAARALVWPFTRPKNANSVDVVVGMTSSLAVIDWAAQDYARATRTLASISQLVTTLRDHFLQGKYFNTSAMCERAVGNNESAFAFYRDALDCYELAGARRYADDIENNIAGLLIQIGEPDLADRHITQALQSCDDPLTLAQILDTRAKQELAFGHYDEARQLHRESLQILCGLQGVDVYLAESARTANSIDRAEVAIMEQSFTHVIA